MNVKDASGRLARWALLLQQYDFEIVHRPGKVQGNADSLSRRPHVTSEFNSLQREDPQVSKTREMQRRDVELSEIIDFLESDVLPFDDRDARFAHQYCFLLYHLDSKRRSNSYDSFSQLVVPASLRFEILSNVHDHVSGVHFGVHKTFDKVKQRYW